MSENDSSDLYNNTPLTFIRSTGEEYQVEEREG
jgi:hypothetical protein